MAGVEGNGQTELAEALVGLRAPEDGRVLLGGRDIAGWPVDRIREAGVAFVPEDRHEQGLILNMSVWENVVLGRHDERPFSSRAGVLVDRQDQGARRAAGEAVTTYAREAWP